MTLCSTLPASKPECGCLAGICRGNNRAPGSECRHNKNAAPVPVAVRESVGVQAFVEQFTKTDVPTILREMAQTFQERNKVYGSNYQMVGPIMTILFPKGVSPELLGSDQFHLFELVIVKLSRLAISDLKHLDSAHDAAIYCAMIESIISSQPKI